MLTDGRIYGRTNGRTYGKPNPYIAPCLRQARQKAFFFFFFFFGGGGGEEGKGVLELAIFFKPRIQIENKKNVCVGERVEGAGASDFFYYESKFIFSFF